MRSWLISTCINNRSTSDKLQQNNTKAVDIRESRQMESCTFHCKSLGVGPGLSASLLPTISLLFKFDENL
ncbi:hypothetical protein Leryth_019370 [Lithospermum erythrorhizon]|nr:hypothetical protein Leryth_019370 [Lithospermum erythrorhizon]